MKCCRATAAVAMVGLIRENSKKREHPGSLSLLLHQARVLQLILGTSTALTPPCRTARHFGARGDRGRSVAGRRMKMCSPYLYEKVRGSLKTLGNGSPALSHRSQFFFLHISLGVPNHLLPQTLCAERNPAPQTDTAFPATLWHKQHRCAACAGQHREVRKSPPPPPTGRLRVLREAR